MNETTLHEKLTAINKLVYKNFTYETDIEHYGVIEKWVMPPETYTGRQKFVGDCEDFAMYTRKLCREAGLQTRLVVCLMGDEGHCVLECEGWIMCCNQEDVHSRDALEKQGYQFLYMSGYEPQDPWYEIIA